MDTVGILTLVVRAFTWVLQAQERHDHEHLGQKIRRIGFRGFDNHTSQTHVDGDARQLTAGMGERHLAALAADGLELGELIETVRHGLHIRRIDEPEVRDVLGRAGHAHRQHVEHHGTQRGTQDFRLREARSSLVILTRIQADRDAVGHAAASAGPLVGTGLADRLDRQTLDLCGLRIPGDTGGTGVHHVADAGHGQRGLSHIGGDDDALVKVRFEHLVLVGGGQSGEQRHDLDGVRPSHVLGARAVMMPQCGLELVDVALAGGEDQNIAGTALVGGVDHQFGAGAGHGRGHIGDAVVGIGGTGPAAGPVGIGFRDGAGQLVVIGVTGASAHRESRHFAHQRGRGAKRLVDHLHGEGAAGNLDYRHLLMQGVLEMLLELDRIDGRGGNDELQIAALRQQCRQIAEQKVDVKTALMRLVDDDRIVLGEFRIALDLGEQNTVGHDPQSCAGRAFVGETHLIADLVTELHAHLRGDTFGHRTRGDAARLGVHDLLAVRATAKLKQDFRQLCGFARTGLAGHNNDLGTFDRAGYLITRGRYGKFCRILIFHDELQ